LKSVSDAVDSFEQSEDRLMLEEERASCGVDPTGMQ